MARAVAGPFYGQRVANPSGLARNQGTVFRSRWPTEAYGEGAARLVRTRRRPLWHGPRLPESRDRVSLRVATRQCRSERRESCGDFTKFSSLPSGCKSRPITAEPGRSAVSLAVGAATLRLMRRQASTWAVGPQPRNCHSSREAEGVRNPEGGRGRHREWARRRLPRRGVRPRHVGNGQSGNLGDP